MTTKLVVIGGGIAGLSAGVYARKCGFDVTILESHNIAGGNCTSWRRGGYLFEGGMHWLSGSAKNNLNRLWRHVGALDDSVEIRYKEPFTEFDYDGIPVRFYRDVKLTQKHLLELSPADAKQIRKLCKWVKMIKGLQTPIKDLPGLETTKKFKNPLSSYLSILSIISVFMQVSKIKGEAYINRFKSEAVRSLLKSVIIGDSGILPLVFTLGALAGGDGGFPVGGSLPFTERIVKTFTDLGGKILYNTKATRVIMENNKVEGVMTGETKIPADAVIIASDTMKIDNLFETPPKEKWFENMKAVTEPTMTTFISLGINADLTKYHNYYYFKLKTPIKLADQTYDYLSFSNYSSDPIYSPTGKTAITIQLGGNTYDYWKNAKNENNYTEKKQDLANKVIEALTTKIPEITDKIEVIDVATPLTYERYCDNWKGSWMTEMKSMKMISYPCTIKDLNGVYLAGHRLLPPGGLPSAIISARTAVQHLCRNTKTVFVGEE